MNQLLNLLSIYFRKTGRVAIATTPLPSPLLATNEITYIVGYSVLPVNVMRFKKNVHLLVNAINAGHYVFEK